MHSNIEGHNKRITELQKLLNQAGFYVVTREVEKGKLALTVLYTSFITPRVILYVSINANGEIVTKTGSFLYEEDKRHRTRAIETIEQYKKKVS